MNLRPRIVERFLASEPRAVHVVVAVAKGSTPREAGAFMLVADGAFVGTIGGGQLEFMALDHARRMLAGKTQDEVLQVPLGPGIGQCCGGHVTLKFSSVNRSLAADLLDLARVKEAALREVHIFGAGHVGKALAAGLALLPFTTNVIDTRRAALVDVHADVTTHALALPEAAVRAAKLGSVFIAVTHDHALDFMIAGEALRRMDAAYVGMIGSKTKRVQFGRWFLENGGRTDQLDALVSPIGGSPNGGKHDRDKRPEIIAALTIAEVILRLEGLGGAADVAPIARVEAGVS